MQKIGMFGGTFNPIHIGHIAIAEEILKKVNLDKILFLPSATPPHKDNLGILPFEIRLELIKRVLSNYPKFEASDFDNRDGKPTYTAELMKRMKKQNPEYILFFIIGEDNVVELATWYDYEWLIENVTFIVARRPKVSKVAWEKLPYLSKLIFVETNLYDISSTEIRDNLMSGKSISNLVPESILTYLENYYKQTIRKR